jgi:hypothetical protein
VNDPKPGPNDALCLETLRRMTPGQRRAMAFELAELSRNRLKAGLLQQFPLHSKAELHALYLKRCRRRAATSAVDSFASSRPGGSARHDD